MPQWMSQLNWAFVWLSDNGMHYPLRRQWKWLDLVVRDLQFRLHKSQQQMLVLLRQWEVQ
jgi:hypothetical protein